MFIGEFQHSLDAKGRLTVPAKLRDGLGERFVATKGLEGCLFVFPLSEWESMSQRLKALPLTSKAARSFTRMFFSGATECEMDPQSRILIPANLRQYASIQKDVTIVGVSTRVEIWAREKWEEYCENEEPHFTETAEQLLDF